MTLASSAAARTPPPACLLPPAAATAVGAPQLVVPRFSALAHSAVSGSLERRLCSVTRFTTSWRVVRGGALESRSFVQVFGAVRALE